MGGRVAFVPSVYEQLAAYRQLEESDPEAGGVLLGRLLTSSRDIVIDEVSAPGPGDFRSRQAFTRERLRAQRAVNEAWGASSGTRNYLGEWHSHPEIRPRPSSLDLGEWRRIADEARYEQHFLLFAIVGVGEVGLWEMQKTLHVLGWRRFLVP